MPMDVSLKPLESVAQNSLMLGLFLPIQSGAWSPSTAPRGTSWTFDYNARCTVLAEQLGFDSPAPEIQNISGLAQGRGPANFSLVDDFSALIKSYGVAKSTCRSGAGHTTCKRDPLVIEGTLYAHSRRGGHNSCDRRRSGLGFH